VLQPWLATVLVARNFTIQPRVPSAIYLSHSTRANLREDLVGSQTSSGSQRHVVSNDSTLPRCPGSGLGMKNGLVGEWRISAEVPAHRRSERVSFRGAFLCST
jgi:hypothetical protein